MFENAKRRGLFKSSLVLLASMMLTTAPLYAKNDVKPPVTVALAPTAAAKVDLNSASEKDLEELPGVGPATAKKIVENRPYTKADDLAKAGLSAAKIAKIEPLVTFGAAPAAPAAAAPKTGTSAVAEKTAPAAAAGKIDLNTASEKDLEELPGVGAATAKKIVANRPYASAADLSKAGLSPAKIAKIEPLVAFGAGSTPVVTAPKVDAPKVDAPKVNTPTVPEKSTTAGGKVDINTATDKELEELPGVGPVTAKKIIAGRPYTKVEDLAKAGISASTLAKFESQVTVGAAPAVVKPTVPSTPTATVDPKKTTAEPTPSGVTLTPPVKGMVWVNTESGIYHVEGDRWYGKTKNGKFMSEDDAKKAGFREAK